MGGIFDKLKQKGPAGLPMGVWAGVVAIGLYLVYRHFRGASSGSAGSPAGSVVDGAGSPLGGGGYGSSVNPPAISITVKEANAKQPKHRALKNRKHHKVKHRKPKHRPHHTPTDHRQKQLEKVLRTSWPGRLGLPIPAPKTQTSAQRADQIPSLVPSQSVSTTTTGNSVGTPVKDHKEDAGFALRPSLMEHTETLRPTTPLNKSPRKQKAAGYRV